jgi:hypothetical protein
MGIEDSEDIFSWHHAVLRFLVVFPGFALFLGFWSDLRELEWHSARKVRRWVEKEGCKQLLYWRQMVFSRKKKNSCQAQWEKLSSPGAWSSVYSRWVRPILFNGSLVIRATIQASSARSNVASVKKLELTFFLLCSRWQTITMEEPLGKCDVE